MPTKAIVLLITVYTIIYDIQDGIPASLHENMAMNIYKIVGQARPYPGILNYNSGTLSHIVLFVLISYFRLAVNIT